MNNGERDELIVKLKLIALRDNGVKLPLSKPFQIVKNVGFNKSYAKLSTNVNLSKLSLMSDTNLNKVALDHGICKSPSDSKADVQINNFNISLKSKKYAPPAIINHTPRHGFYRISNQIGYNLKVLDDIIYDYWQKRLAGIITEDTKSCDSSSPFYNRQKDIKDILNYFLFDGTGSKDSNLPADYILEFDDPLDINKWIILDKSNAVSALWDKMVFSLRSKGMPPRYPNISNITRKQIIDVWSKLIDGKFKGSLHIRVKK